MRRIVLVLLAVSVTAHAEVWPPLRPPDPLPLDWVVKNVLTRFPEVHAKHRAYLSALERTPQARAFDDPTVSVMVDNEPTRGVNTGSDPDTMIELSQKLPSRGKRALRAEISEREADLVFLEALEHHLELQWEASQVYYDYLLADQRVEMLENQRRLFEAYAPAVKARSHRPLATPRDLSIDAARTNTRLLKYRQDRRAAMLKLNTLMGRNWEAPLTRPVVKGLSDMPGDREALAAQAFSKSIATRAVGIRIKHADAARQLAEKGKVPDFTVFGRYTIAGDALMDDSVRVGISVNIPLSSRTDHRVAEATHELARWQDEQRAVNNKIVRDVAILHEQASSQRDSFRYYEQDMLPRMQQLSSTAFATYQAGRSDIVQLLETQESLLNAELEALDLRVAYEKTLTDITRLTATLPPYAVKQMSERPLNTPRDPRGKK